MAAAAAAAAARVAAAITLMIQNIHKHEKDYQEILSGAILGSGTALGHPDSQLIGPMTADVRPKSQIR